MLGARQLAAGHFTQFVPDFFEGIGPWNNLFEPPSQGDRSSFMTGKQQGEQSIADFLIAKRPAVLARCRDQVSQDVLAAHIRRLGTAGGNSSVERLVERSHFP